MSLELYDRVECNEEKGTILYIGEVPPTTGLWYGVDWDNERRGKHNGTHNGVKFFETRGDCSGSFVRPTKIGSRLSLEDGIKSKYQDDPTIEVVLTEQLQKSIKARFVQVVGMEKVGKKQSQINKLITVVLDGSPISGPGSSDLMLLFPQIRDLDLSNTLISSWEDIANICQQLKNLKLINLSENRIVLPSDPSSFKNSFRGIAHLVMNAMFGYTWENLLSCALMFDNLKVLQMAFNKLEKLSPINEGMFEFLEQFDIGGNPISDPCEILHLGSLKRLNYVNLNHCQLRCIQFPETPPGKKTPLFPSLSLLNVCHNPLDIWKTTGELDKVASLKELNITHDENKPGSDDYVLEHTFARIRSLEIFNRTQLVRREKRDNQLFYLRHFSSEFYQNGGSDDLPKISLTPQFIERHPSYLALVKALGAPTDERELNTQGSKSLRDLKLSLHIVIPNDESMKPLIKTFLPTIKISRVKMMLKRQLAIDPNASLKLSYEPKAIEGKPSFEIEMENDMHNLQYYSIADGDTIVVRW